MLRFTRITLLAVLCGLIFSIGLADEPAACIVPEDGCTFTVSQDVLQLMIPVGDPCHVTLSVSGPEGPVFQRDYGVCSEDLMSEEVYLRLNGHQTVYTVHLACGDESTDFSIIRQAPQMEHVTGCSLGVPIEVLTGISGRETVSMISGQDGSSTLPVQAAGCVIGEAVFTVSGGSLSVSFSPCPGVTVEGSRLLVAANAEEGASLLQDDFSGVQASFGQPVPLYGAPAAAVWLSVTATFDPALLSEAQDTPPSQWQLYFLWENSNVALPNG